MQLYKKPDGFTQEEIYRLCGRDDSVTTISLKPDSDGFLAFGEDVTVCFVYTPKERKSLEKDPASLNETPCVKARALLPDYDTAKADNLLTSGVNTHDIVQLLVLPGTKPENTFYSDEKRSPNVPDGLQQSGHGRCSRSRCGRSSTACHCRQRWYGWKPSRHSSCPAAGTRCSHVRCGPGVRRRILPV